MGATKEKKPKFNRNLLSLKAVLFFFFAGVANIHVLNSLHPLKLGLNFEEYRFISIIVPIVSILGPLIAGPLADKLAARNASTYGRSLRILTAICLIIATILYSCIFFIPSVQRFESRRPLVSFGCDSQGAIIFQERCTEERTCFHWTKEKFGSLILTNCSYTCQNPSQFESMYDPWTKGSPVPPTEVSSESDYEQYDESTPTAASKFKKRAAQNIEGDDEYTEMVDVKPAIKRVFVEPPHICTRKMNQKGVEMIDRCHVYTSDTESLKIHATLRSATNKENDTHSADWCNYPLDGFQCDIPKDQVQYMIGVKNSSKCKPMVECEVIDPYDSPGSVLAESQCMKVIGDVDTTYWGYFLLRLFAEIFPMAALTLLNTAVIIATRDTSTGRGEVCRQFVWGGVGWILSLPHIKLFGGEDAIYISDEYLTVMLVVFIVCFLLAAVILLMSKNMPLSPPEWWWHTKTGMLVYPMSAIRKYGPETFALTLIALVLGIFWSSIHSYLPWTYFDYFGITFIGILPLLLMFFNVDKFIEYCGHSNILIGAFAVYIIRFTALTFADEADWLTIIMESLEPLTLGMTWVTIVLYMRHIMPRKFSGTGQAIVVIAHFCLGKCFGALIGLAKKEKYPTSMSCIFEGLAIAACVIAIIYFIMYNLLIAPRCAAKSHPLAPVADQTQPQNNGTSTNGTNGNYTPLRVYHNERGKKGQFRY